jgi:exodeoxyribonuclease V beta subunit
MPFDSRTISIKNRKLIEASAGTGKTFSIAILVLRVIVEKDIELKKLLMVTFTNAAVAELEIRIRKFIRQAYGYINGNENVEGKIIELLDYQRNELKIGDDLIRKRLHRAVQSLDDLNVMTIHSFCQETLKEFSFETNHVFESEIITDESELQEYVINDFWRHEITTLGANLLKSLMEHFDDQLTSGLTKLRRLLTRALVCVTDEKKFIPGESSTPDNNSGENIYNSYINSLTGIANEYDQFISNNETDIKNSAHGNTLAKDFLGDLTMEAFAKVYCDKLDIKGYFFDDLLSLLANYHQLKTDTIPESEFLEFVDKNGEELEKHSDSIHAMAFMKELLKTEPGKVIAAIDKKIRPAYLEKGFPLVFVKTLERKIKENELKNRLKTDILNYLLFSMFKNYSPEISEMKRARNQVSYNDLIKKVHGSIDRVKDELAGKFDVLFIDEFQDTDKYQYEIFSGIFGEKTIFFIGDPKQSIYGWRKADLNTYKVARRSVGEDSVSEMNSNFRSTPRMLDAMGLFFKSVDNMFIDDEIRYYDVFPGKPGMEEMKEGDDNVVPISIIEHDADNVKTITGKNNSAKEDFHKSIIDFVVSETERLIHSGEFLIKGEPVKPSDIGILVRENNQAKEIKEALSQKKIPAITLDDTQVLKSIEAGQLYNLLIAVNHPSKKSINRALLNTNFGFNTISLAKLKHERILEEFDLLRVTWKKDGIYAMLSEFMDKFNVRSLCSAESNKGGQRSLSNYYQIMEILHDFETRGKLKEEEIISKFSKAINNKIKEDEYIQRLESDENAVKIVTIHKSKGLEYNIVFAPFLDLTSWTKEIVEYRDPTTGEYCFALNDRGRLRRRNLSEIDQENRRLIYVALTRAVYKCYININYYEKLDHSSVKQFVANLKKSGEADTLDTSLIGIAKVIKPAENKFTREPDTAIPAESLTVKGIGDFVKTWGVHSFSSLSQKHDIITSEAHEINEEYNRFVFNEMPKGAKAGLFLHSIFEHLDFSDPAGYLPALESSGEFYSSIYKPEHKNFYLRLINHCMDVEIKTKDGGSLKLREVKNKEKLPELEFYYSIDSHQKSEIIAVIDDIDFTTDPLIEGMMHGFMDLLFKHGTSYYILDWKSNFLGNSLTDYGEAGLAEGMRGSNYHLQYFIYTVAVKRYLEKKLAGFNYEKHFGGVIYMFLRGVRDSDSTKGIFFEKPSLEKISRLEALFYKDL